MEPRTNFARGASRVVIDAQGEHWFVFEHTPEYDRRATPTLVFMSELIVRRVRTFPANWEELSDSELFAVSWRR